jgi:PAS domain S-box-containing protein
MSSSAKYRELAILARGGPLSFRAGRLNELSPEVKLVAGFGLAFATLIAVGIIQHRSIQALIDTDGSVAHTHAVLTEVEAAYSDLQRAESGGRGFVATGQEEYLRQLEAGTAGSADHLRALRRLSAGNSPQQLSLERLKTLSEAKIANLQALVALRRNQGFDVASQELRGEGGLRLINEIRMLVDAIEAQENGLLEARQAASEANARKANAVTVLGTLLALALVMAATWITRRDVLQRRRAEEALQRRTQELDGFFRVSLDLLCIATTDGYFLSLNPAWETTLEYTRDELMATTFLDFVHAEDVESTRKAVASLASQREVNNFVNRYRHRDGTYRWLEWKAAPAGKLIFAAARDITDRKRTEEEIRELNADLERRVAQRTAQLAVANRELEAFSYSVAHDLRAPLSSMDGFSLALLEDYGPKLDEQAQNYLQGTRAATLRMGQLIDDLLNLSRIARVEVRKERIDFSALALALVSDLQKSKPEREVEFVIPPGLEVEGDPHLLRVALENLLGNAWKFSAQRRPAHIEMGLTEQDGRKAYFVRDNGAGFDMAYAGKLFAPFQRLHSATEFPGTGIGLATVARIVRKHGGEVWAEGEVDKGATFYFTLEGQSRSRKLKVKGQRPKSRTLERQRS